MAAIADPRALRCVEPRCCPKGPSWALMPQTARAVVPRGADGLGAAHSRGHALVRVVPFVGVDRRVAALRAVQVGAAAAVLGGGGAGLQAVVAGLA
eukprot:CAMPEP_0194572938 /NCGR_PEP_ID=MMETSP0292-20121207/9318_1 /TAXON_ID=39354 /ORGANISM="Heterosigma akashiwo, Strain CCMP2393" /LENGTH=95 /DNA_ID=CAMNT_0039424017 /DNA_START=1110 /DNA_END=1397 /DNA_ORIENTATION=+